ncbi:MAG: O-antigen ligase family protein, partial [Verrucomicrobiae bacterium]|nr:O-antigen ligase family protein [Verrucomicrobiae bacterium]
MRTLYNGLILGAWAACVLAALVAFGGVVADFALPFYLAAAALAVVWALKLFTVRGQTMPWTPLHVPVLALFLYVALRAFTAPLRHDAQWELLRAGVYTLIYFAAAFNFHRSRYRAVVLTVLVVAAVLESLYGYWQYATRTDKVFLFPRDEQYRGRASGTYICPNHLAGWLEVLALVVLAQLLVNRRPLASLEHSVIVKFLEVTALGAILVGLVSTGSRGGWFALAIGATVLWLWAWQTQLIPPRVADAMMVLLVLAFAGMLAIPAVRERVWEVLSVNFGYAFEYGVVRLTDPGLAGRAAMTAACWQMFCEHPWVGVGPGAWRWFEAE